MGYTLSLAACGLPAEALPAAERRMKQALEMRWGGPAQVLDACNAGRYSAGEEAAALWKDSVREALEDVLKDPAVREALGGGPISLPEDVHERVAVTATSAFSAGHRSRLGCLVIDCQTGDAYGAAAFWSAALGWPLAPQDPGADARYRQLQSPDSEVNVLVQAVEHPSRVHLDIETDDIDAEVARLESLGARRVAFVQRWWVMESPTGQRFCVVRPQRPDFEEHANLWPRALAHPAGGHG